jgi:FKBP-type peptidyl-prolyl cis-trans isomerase (trigger factor)
LASADSCKKTLEITVPADEVEAETGRAVAKVGNARSCPVSGPAKPRPPSFAIFAVRYPDNRFEAEDLKAVGQPDITEVHLDPGEPLRFKAEFEANRKLSSKITRT